MFNTKKIRKFASMAALGMICFCGQTATAQATDPALKSLFAKVAASYRGLKSFSGTIDTTDGDAAHQIRTVLQFSKPNQFKALIIAPGGKASIVSDGTNTFTTSSRLKGKYLKEPASSFGNCMGMLREVGGGGVGLLPIALTAPDAELHLVPGKPESIKKAADATVGGEACIQISAITIGQKGKQSYIIFISKHDYLLRKLVVADAKPGSKPIVVETYSAVKANPSLPSAEFRFSAPTGYVAVDPNAQQTPYDPKIKVGASPLPITGQDLAGKPVSLTQYRGKVLLVDFWATWCGPCLAEMPNVISAYNKYHSRGFEIVGVTLDKANYKNQVQDFIRDNHMPWRQIYQGKYWDSDNAQAYGLHGIPFMMLIGKSGKIAAINARGDLLAPAIEAALNKK